MTILDVSVKLLIIWAVIFIIAVVMFIIGVNQELKRRKHIRNHGRDILRVSDKLFTEWLDEQDDYGVCTPPMDAQTALNYLFDYLGIAPVVIPESCEQCNTEIVFDILMKYSPEFRSEYYLWKNSFRPR